MVAIVIQANYGSACWIKSLVYVRAIGQHFKDEYIRSLSCCITVLFFMVNFFCLVIKTFSVWNKNNQFRSFGIHIAGLYIACIRREKLEKVGNDREWQKGKGYVCAFSLSFRASISQLTFEGILVWKCGKAKIDNETHPAVVLHLETLLP